MANAPWMLESTVVCDELDVDAETGLTTQRAAELLAAVGRNELDPKPPISRLQRIAAQFQDPLVLLLVVAIAISGLAWWSDGAEGPPLEAIVIGAIVVVNAAIGYWQESRAIKAVAALQEMTMTHTTVVRDSVVRSLTSGELVPGDIIVLGEGDAVGADARLIEAASLEVAEAPLTGESESVSKNIEPLRQETDLADRVNMVFAGTAVGRGRGRAVVTATAMETEIGKIATLLDEAVEEPTPLQRQIDWLSKVLGITVVVLAAIVVGAIVITSNISAAADVFEALLVGVSLAVAAVPEGLPAILTVVLALGVQRMAIHHAVVKKLRSVETLGSASVICTDKTGTLTRNEMTILRVITASADAEVTGIGNVAHGEVLIDGQPVLDQSVREEIELVLGAGSLANDASIRLDDSGVWEVTGDPTEVAFLVAERKTTAHERRANGFQRVAEVPFDSERKLMTTVNRPASGDPTDLIAVTKGAPDVLLERCTHMRVGGQVVELTENDRNGIGDAIDRLAGDALRTLAVGYRPLPDSGMVDAGMVDAGIERDLTYLGVVGITDPPRPEAATAIAEAQRAGVRVIMITGDHPQTAMSIGTSLGIGNPVRGENGIANDEAVASTTGRELATLDDDEFAKAVREHSVFARVAPEHKLRIVGALQKDGHVVAMTGDGVNDAPALKQADIGVAMGVSGTEVAKEASDMILADDNFATILHAVREGREIFADIGKFLRYLLASNTGEVLVVFVGVLGAGILGLTDSTGGLAIPLLATQILWINLLTDSALALALGVDPAVEDVMAQGPRNPTDRIIDRSMLLTIVLVGSVTALAGLIALDLELQGGLLGGSGEIESARTMLFTTIVLAQVFNAFNSRTDRVSALVRPFSNRLLWLAVAITVALQVAVVHLAPLQRGFETAPLDIGQWATCVGLASTVLIADEVRKFLGRRRAAAQS